MTFRIPALVFALAVALPAAGETVDPAKSEIAFTSKQMGVAVEGRFRKFSGQVSFDPKKPAAAKATIEVELASIDAGSPDANAEVPKKAWFNTAAFPKATFVSGAVRQVAPGRFEAKGTLSIKGVSKEVTTQFTAKSTGGATTYEGSFPLLRLQFGIGEGAWSDTDTVADEVQIRYRLVAAGGK